MGKSDSFRVFLSDAGEVVYQALLSHCNAKLKMMEVDHYELAMLANSFALYAESARFCNEEGVAMPAGDSGYEQIRPQYTVMKNEYANILKHSAKFGLNPGDRAKFFKGLEEDKKKKGFKLDGDLMKAS
jgi:phage terminase small subunit